LETYIVGGSIRDILLGNSPKDIDYVVIGSSPQEMISNGFKQVGAAFPVYLHPTTGEEYALGRTEKKIGVGYNGFECNISNVSLKDDLSRRDLTINSLAVKLEHWGDFLETMDRSLVIDYFGGLADLDAEILCHINECFKNDPVRVLRTARFAARYDFNVSQDTIELMKQVAPELNFVNPERIWLEFEKGLMEDYPCKMLDVLIDSEVFDVEIMKPFHNTQVPRYFTRLVTLDTPKLIQGMSLDMRFAMLPSAFSVTDYKTHRIPVDCSALHSIVAQFGSQLAMFDKLDAPERLMILSNFRLNSIQGIEFLNKVLRVITIAYKSVGMERALQQLWSDVNAISDIDYESIVSQCAACEISEKIKQARLAVMVNI
jgi:hypothetical protein